MPADMSRYPANWASEIRPRILARAGDRCEWCKAPNRAIGHRLDGEWTTGEGCGDRSIRIVLTVAHIDDPEPTNADEANLAALCQRCHNRHDARMRREHAAETRRRRKVAGGQAELTLEEGRS